MVLQINHLHKSFAMQADQTHAVKHHSTLQDYRDHRIDLLHQQSQAPLAIG